jgi:hypothetical protein
MGVVPLGAASFIFCLNKDKLPLEKGTSNRVSLQFLEGFRDD